MSLVGNYVSSVERAFANMQAAGREYEDRNAGRKEGYRQGLQEGYQQGYNAGWNAAAATGNAKIHTLNTSIHRQMVFAQLKEEGIKQQREVGLAIRRILNDQLEELKRENTKLRGENAKLRKSDSALREWGEALKGVNQRLREQVADLNAKYQKKSSQHTERLWQYNRILVFVNSVYRVLHALTCEDTPQAERVRELFVKNYAQQISKALKVGAIKAPPENDPEFVPQIRQFILNMLQSVGR